MACSGILIANKSGSICCGRFCKIVPHCGFIKKKHIKAAINLEMVSKVCFWGLWQFLSLPEFLTTGFYFLNLCAVWACRIIVLTMYST